MFYFVTTIRLAVVRNWRDAFWWVHEKCISYNKYYIAEWEHIL